MRTPNSSRKNYTLEFKNLVVQFAEASNNSRASAHFDVPRQCVQSWRKQKLQLLETDIGIKKRLKGGGRKLKNVKLDEKMEEWLGEMKKNGEKITGAMIQEQAMRLSEGNSEFKASNGWLQRFMIRHGLRLGPEKMAGNLNLNLNSNLDLPNLEDVLRGLVADSGANFEDLEPDLEFNSEDVRFGEFEDSEDVQMKQETSDSEDVEISKNSNFFRNQFFGVPIATGGSSDASGVNFNDNGFFGGKFENLNFSRVKKEEEEEELDNY